MYKTTTKILAFNLLFALKPVNADDIDVYIQKPPDPVSPNVLFVLDRSGSMSWRRPSRMSQLKTAMNDLLSSEKMEGVNAGIMSYSSSPSSSPMKMVSSFKIIGDHKSTMISAVNAISARGGTPTVSALDAALKWYQGSYFSQPSPFGNTPENNWCKSNQIVLLSDGSPNSNSMTSFPAGTICPQDPYQSGGRCSQEIAKWAKEKDFKTGGDWDIGLSEGKRQNIITHTIGFDTPEGSNLSKYLKGISTAGGGEFYPASNSSDLLSAFSSIIETGVTTVDYAYASPVIPYNPDNTAVSGEYIYIPTLKPSEKTFWKGNLKKYKITNDSSGIIIKDKNNNSIIDTDYTFISSTDLWSVSADGGDTLKNGAARLQDTSLSGNRKLYSNIEPSISDLTAITNLVNQANPNLTNGLLGVSNTNDRTDVLSWINWEEPNSGFLTGVDR
jgi:type IV pilus assembly protein PilY1